MDFGLDTGAQQSLFADLKLSVLLSLCLFVRICSVVLRLSNFAVRPLLSVKVCSVVQPWPCDDPLPFIHMALAQTVLPSACLC